MLVTPCPRCLRGEHKTDNSASRVAGTFMADILPFRALRYDPSKVTAGEVMTQPYDKITPAMQDRVLRSQSL